MEKLLEDGSSRRSSSENVRCASSPTHSGPAHTRSHSPPRFARSLLSSGIGSLGRLDYSRSLRTSQATRALVQFQKERPPACLLSFSRSRSRVSVRCRSALETLDSEVGIESEGARGPDGGDEGDLLMGVYSASVIGSDAFTLSTFALP